MEMLRDITIVKMRRDQKKQKFQTIESGMYAGDEFITFGEVILFDGNMRIFLPDSFVDMPEEYVVTKYPLEERPEIIKMGVGGSVAFSFQLVGQQLDDSETEVVINRLGKTLKQIQPFNLFLDSGSILTPESSVAWIDFKGYGIDQALYQCLFLTPVKGQMMLGMFHCAFSGMESWKPIIMEVLKTIC